MMHARAPAPARPQIWAVGRRLMEFTLCVRLSTFLSSRGCLLTHPQESTHASQLLTHTHTHTVKSSSHLAYTHTAAPPPCPTNLQPSAAAERSPTNCALAPSAREALVWRLPSLPFDPRALFALAAVPRLRVSCFSCPLGPNMHLIRGRPPPPAALPAQLSAEGGQAPRAAGVAVAPPFSHPSVVAHPRGYEKRPQHCSPTLRWHGKPGC
jgi:hypothetical protein